MRYRVKDYTVQPVAGGVWLYFTAPQGVQLSSDPDNEIEPFIQEAIRLVIDESDGIVLCSSMQKRVYLERAKCTPSTHEVRLLFALPEGETASSTDMFTIEMDWGDEPDMTEETISVDIVCDGYHTEPDPDYTYHEIVPIEEVARPKTHLKIVNKTAAPNISSGYNVLVDGKLFYDSPQSYADKYDAGAVLVDEDIYGKEIAFVHYTAAQQHSSHTLTADVTYSIEGGIYGASKAVSAKFAAIAASIDFTPVEEKIDSLDEKITPYLYERA